MMWRFIIILSLLLVAEYYSFWVVRSALRTASPTVRTTVLILYAILTVATWLSFILFRQLNWSAMPHMVRNIFVAFTLGFVIGKLLILVVMLGDEIRRLIVWIASLFKAKSTVAVASAGEGITRSVFIARLALLIGAGTLGGFLYGITNRYDYRIRRQKLKFPNLPNSFRGMKIVQISDIHSGSFDSHEAVARGVQMAMNEKPDIIFFTGDLVNNKAEEIVPYTDIFSKLRAPLGVYSTLGNHDYGDYVEWPTPAAKKANLEHLKAIHGQMGWKLMMNEHVRLQRNGEEIAVLGIENWGAKRGFPKYGDMSKAYKGLENTDVFKILLSHDPSHWDNQVIQEYPDIDLTFSGHTHGMQFGIEIPGLKWSPVQYVYKNWAGHYKQGKQHLYVNRGFGFLGYPGRLGILPEITVIELV